MAGKSEAGAADFPRRPREEAAGERLELLGKVGQMDLQLTTFFRRIQEVEPG